MDYSPEKIVVNGTLKYQVLTLIEGRVTCSPSFETRGELEGWIQIQCGERIPEKIFSKSALEIRVEHLEKQIEQILELLLEVQNGKNN